MKGGELMGKSNDTASDLQLLMSRHDAVAKMYTAIANGEDVEEAAKEFSEWNEQRIKKNEGEAVLC